MLVPAEITCCTPAFLRDNDDARDGVCMYVGQSQEVIFDGWNSRGVLIESRFVFDACFTRIAKTGPKNTALTAWGGSAAQLSNCCTAELLRDQP